MPKTGVDRMDDHNLCTAKRRNGKPCLNYAINGSNVCRMHGGAAPQVRAAAQVRILMASDLAAKKLVDLMESPKVDDRVKLAAAKDLLDRANLAGKQSIEVGVVQPKSFEDWIGEAIVDTEEDDDEYAPLVLPPGREDIVDADVVEDEPAMNRHDRAAFVEVSRAPKPQKRTPERAKLDAEEEAIFAEQARRESQAKANRRREAFMLAIDAGATREMAEEAGRRAAKSIRPDLDRPRRARQSTAEIVRD